MGFRRVGSYAPLLWLWTAAEAMAAAGAKDTKEEGAIANGYAAWPFPLLLSVCVLNVALAAMFAGLTIGLFGMDFIMLDIISSAGKEPDRTYAKKILPIRRYGHQLLATLLIGNMLAIVVISQMVAAMVRSTEFVNFIVATVVVFVLAEIIPMGVCNKGPYALWVGAKSAPIVSIALFLLYPVAKPLGMLLECLVTHDEGLVYDRNELKKLLRIHFEKYADKCGLGDDEMRMITGALEMNEANLSGILTPLDRTQMLASTLPLTRKLLEQLWICGKSRLPVYANDCPSDIIGVLYVRDLINIPLQQMDGNLTVGSLLDLNPRDIFIVPDTMMLHELLRVFLSKTSHLLLVEKELVENQLSEVGGEGVGAGAANMTTVSEDRHTVPSQVKVIASRSSPASRSPRHIIGIVTLEDVIERIIKADIYDEYDQSMEESDSKLRKEEGHGEEGETGFQKISPVPRVAPRVNFYSYVVENEGAGADDTLTTEQKWALASFFINSYVAFAMWSLPQVKCFIDYIGDRVVRLPEQGEEGPVLYRRGERSDAFTLLLSGGVRIVVGDGAFTAEKRSFSSFGEVVLLREGIFVPDYTAVISRTSRYIRFTWRELREAERRIGVGCKGRQTTGTTMTTTFQRVADEGKRRVVDEDIPLP
ncbi:hypothetical protein DQ04_01941050 [Trypanosoma grayi]|uniref:hypothetical protein n=1 Tax=Trypanosoma grayi TaxID=71804 RepID=UPI0004F44CC0|nr:hypothetical protein DQ04_01941050 [Trypanosoma grayi]KEG12158.1 hypothetical protein DQ04_01941050 [Trypanosoma grayi]